MWVLLVIVVAGSGALSVGGVGTEQVSWFETKEECQKYADGIAQAPTKDEPFSIKGLCLPAMDAM
jgi:hypothetical protein